MYLKWNLKSKNGYLVTIKGQSLTGHFKLFVIMTNI